jgi:hypothetical protein
MYLSHYLLKRARISFVRAPPSWPNCLPKAPSPNTITLEIKTLSCVGRKKLVHNRWPPTNKKPGTWSHCCQKTPHSATVQSQIRKQTSQHFTAVLWDQGQNKSQLSRFNSWPQKAWEIKCAVLSSYVCGKFFLFYTTENWWIALQLLSSSDCIFIFLMHLD